VAVAAIVGLAGVTAIDTSVAAVTVSRVFPLTLPSVALIVVLPAFSAEAKPTLLIVAVVVLDEAHVTLAVRFCVELSLYVPVAVNWSVPPAATDGFTGVTAIDTSVAAVTVSRVFPLTLPSVALIVVLPAFSAEARPALLIVAVVVLEDAHVTLAVRFCVELSL
jgi:stage V sporulation protein SpoVS